MAVKALRRYIKFGKQLLPIPTGMTYEKAIDHYSTAYPELTNAVQEGSKTEEGKFIYLVTTSIGDKG